MFVLLQVTPDPYIFIDPFLRQITDLLGGFGGFGQLLGETFRLLGGYFSPFY